MGGVLFHVTFSRAYRVAGETDENRLQNSTLKLQQST